MATGTQKVVYLDNDVLEEVQKANSNFSRRVNDLIRKGLKFEANMESMGVRGHIEGLVRLYNKTSKHPITL